MTGQAKENTHSVRPGIWMRSIRDLNPAYFALVMSTVCTHRLAQVTHFPLIDVIPAGFVYIAVTAWLITFIGMLRDIWKGLKETSAIP